MKYYSTIFILLILFSHLSATEKGLIRVKSSFDVHETVLRFEKAIKKKGLKVFPRVDHSAAAKEYGLNIKPTIVVSFGNPKYGTPFMLKNPEAGIDFPPKAIVYEDHNGDVWLAYNSAEYLYHHIFKRHDLEIQNSSIDFFRESVSKFVELATKQN